MSSSKRSDVWLSQTKREKDFWINEYSIIVYNFYKEIDKCIHFYKDYIDNNEISEFVFTRLQDPYWDSNKPYIYYFTQLTNKFDFYDDLHALTNIQFSNTSLTDKKLIYRKKKLEENWIKYKSLLIIEDKLIQDIDNAVNEQQLNMLEDKLTDLREQIDNVLYLFIKQRVKNKYLYKKSIFSYLGKN